MLCDYCGSPGARHVPTHNADAECLSCALSVFDHFMANAYDVDTDPSPDEMHQDILALFPPAPSV